MTTSPTLMQGHEYRTMFELETAHWWYRGLRLWLSRALAQHVAAPGPVLDAGCGTGANLAHLQALGYAAQGLDLSPAGLRLARDRGTHPRLYQASAAILPHRDASFAAVLSADVLYLLGEADEARSLAEFRRVLAPGGVLLLNLPAFEWLRGEHDRVVRTQRRYTASTLRAKLQAAGFRPLSIEYRYTSLLPAIALVRRVVRPGDESGASARSDTRMGTGPANGLLTALVRGEERLGSRISRPFGSSVSAVAVVDR